MYIPFGSYLFQFVLLSKFSLERKHNAVSFRITIYLNELAVDQSLHPLPGDQRKYSERATY